MGRKRQTIGVIWPGKLDARYEWAQLEAWLCLHGLRISVATVESPSDGLHDLGSLRATGATDALAAAASSLRSADCSAVIWACTSGSFVDGLQQARRQARLISEAAGAPATSASLALVAATAALQACDIDLLSPYPPDATDRLLGFLGEAGLAVVECRALGCADGTASNSLALPEAVSLFRSRMSESRRPLVIPDTAINSLEVVGRLEVELDRPVITANQACVWHGLALANFRADIPAAGSLWRAACRKEQEPAAS
jgi:maleate isomerase